MRGESWSSRGRILEAAGPGEVNARGIGTNHLHAGAGLHID
jgi:hypothetical protein